MKRIGLEDVLTHPWMKRYLPQLESDEVQDDISERALAYLVTLGHSRLEILHALVNEETTALTAAYHLLAERDGKISLCADDLAIQSGSVRLKV